MQKYRRFPSNFHNNLYLCNGNEFVIMEKMYQSYDI